MTSFPQVKTKAKDGLLRQWQCKLSGLCLMAGVFVYLEVLLHLFVFGSFGSRIGYPVLFALIAGTILYFLGALLPRKVNRIISFCFICLLVIYFEIQLVYHGIFGSFMPVAQLALGADAVTNFAGQALHGIWQNIIPFLLFLLPIPAAGFLLFSNRLKTERLTLQQAGVCVLLILVLMLGTVGILRLSDDSPASALKILLNPNASTEACIKNVGVAATTLQEVRGLIFGKNEASFNISGLDGSSADLADGSSRYNCVDIDFSAQMEKTDDNRLRELDRYFSYISPTPKNEYTGIAQGYNLIMLCAESFSPQLIDPELTPTLYKLSTNGFVFNNFYCSFPNTTTNGEYAFCTGLLPDMSRTKTASSFDASCGHYLPYCMGNVFSALGANAYGFHNYYGTFYNRDVTHANIGYQFQAIGSGLDIPVDWPASDLDMINASADQFLSDGSRFCTYYMTFSGHYQYNWDNAMSEKNRAAVEQLPYSDTVKAYLACNLELEYALTELMDRLEQAGVAERTVIVLTSDHYPYGLTEEEYNELAGEEVDTVFEKYRNSFICYVPQMEPVIVDDYCSTIDILPTLLNLFGVEYDSRLLAGKDVLADCTHVAVLSDQSYLTDTFRYDAATGTATAYDGSEVDPATVQEYCDYVSKLFSISSEILLTDYYAHIFDGNATVDFTGSIVYTDVTNIFLKSGVLFVVQNGYMQPDSDTVFGAERELQSGELYNALYQMEGAPAVQDDASLPRDTQYRDAMLWARAVKLISDDCLWDTPVTYEQVSVALCRYARLHEQEITMDAAELASARAYYPALSEEAIIAMNWCKRYSIISGIYDGPLYGTADVTINRGQLAAYLQRFYFKINN